MSFVPFIFNSFFNFLIEATGVQEFERVRDNIFDDNIRRAFSNLNCGTTKYDLKPKLLLPIIVISLVLL